MQIFLYFDYAAGGTQHRAIVLYYWFVHKLPIRLQPACLPGIYKINSVFAFTRFISHTFSIQPMPFESSVFAYDVPSTHSTLTMHTRFKFPHESHFWSSTSVFIDLCVCARMWVLHFIIVYIIWVFVHKKPFSCRQSHSHTIRIVHCVNNGQTIKQ